MKSAAYGRILLIIHVIWGLMPLELAKRWVPAASGFSFAMLLHA